MKVHCGIIQAGVTGADVADGRSLALAAEVGARVEAVGLEGPSGIGDGGLSPVTELELPRLSKPKLHLRSFVASPGGTGGGGVVGAVVCIFGRMCLVNERGS